MYSSNPIEVTQEWSDIPEGCELKSSFIFNGEELGTVSQVNKKLLDLPSDDFRDYSDAHKKHLQDIYNKLTQ